MPKSKHTEGPWNVYADIEVYGKGRFVAMTLPCNADVATAEDYANARLIAAAPELLEACEKAIDDWEHNLTEAMQMIQAAVNKAREGE